MQAIAEKRAMRVSSPVVLGVPGINMRAEEGELVTEILLPEFKEDEIRVTADSEGLVIDALRSNKSRETPGRQSYWRHLSLPSEAQPEAMKQVFRGGKLRITMPVGEPLDVFEKELMRREEIGHDLRENTPKAKRTKTFGFRDQEFPNHWTRYRPVR